MLHNSRLPHSHTERLNLVLGGSVTDPLVDTEMVVLEILYSLAMMDFKRPLYTFYS